MENSELINPSLHPSIRCTFSGLQGIKQGSSLQAKPMKKQIERLERILQLLHDGNTNEAKEQLRFVIDKLWFYDMLGSIDGKIDKVKSQLEELSEYMDEMTAKKKRKYNLTEKGRASLQESMAKMREKLK